MGHTNGLNVAGCRLSNWALAAHKLWQARLSQRKDVCVTGREKGKFGEVGKKLQRRVGSTAGATWIGCALLALPQIKGKLIKATQLSHCTHTHPHAVTHPHTHTQSFTLSYTHTHTYVAHSSMHMHIKAARGVCVILCIRSLRSVRSPAFVFAIRCRRSRRRKANEYALYLLNKRPF